MSRDEQEELVEALARLRARVIPLVLARQERRREGASPAERLSAPQQLTLAALADGPLSVSQVAAATGVAVSTATRMLQSLGAAGWVEPGPPDTDDRRRRPVALTAAGRRVLDEADAAVRARLRGLLERLDASERAAILGGLEALARALQEDEEASERADTASRAASSSASRGGGGDSGEAPSGRIPSKTIPR